VVDETSIVGVTVEYSVVGSVVEVVSFLYSDTRKKNNSFLELMTALTKEIHFMKIYFFRTLV